jgi:hypothetical protein
MKKSKSIAGVLAAALTAALILALALAACGGGKGGGGAPSGVRESAAAAGEEASGAETSGAETASSGADKSDSKAVDKFLKDYEAVVVALEKAAKGKDVSDLASAALKVEEIYEKSEKILDNTDAWSESQMEKMAALVQRASAAAAQASNLEMPGF